MITQKELEEWREDIKRAENTHPNAFANVPFIRSLFKVATQISSASQQIAHMTTSVWKVDESLKNLTGEIKSFNQATTQLTEKANKLIWWYVILTGVIAAATIVNIFL